MTVLETFQLKANKWATVLLKIVTYKVLVYKSYISNKYVTGFGVR